MEAIAQLFPFLVFILACALIVFVIRLDRRLSRGSRSPGPRQVVRATPVGQRQTPWELQAINDQLRLSTNARARTDLVNTLNRLTTAAGLRDPSFTLPPNASDLHISTIVERLERQLELPPLTSFPTAPALGQYPANQPANER